MINYDTFYNATFIGEKEYGGFKRGLPYTIKISDEKPYGLSMVVFGQNDFENKIPYCNLKSIERVWEIGDEI